jgi:hypothetical protein
MNPINYQAGQVETTLKVTVFEMILGGIKMSY